MPQGVIFYKTADREWLETLVKWLGEPTQSVAANWLGSRFECTPWQLVAVEAKKAFHVRVYQELPLNPDLVPEEENI